VAAGGGVETHGFIDPGFDSGDVCPSSTIVWALFGLGFGLPAAVWPDTVARWGEILDAIGREPAGQVEPTDTNVYLTRAAGAVVATFGLLAAVSCL
jgi:hypothetical protein